MIIKYNSKLSSWLIWVDHGDETVLLLNWLRENETYSGSYFYGGYLPYGADLIEFEDSDLELAFKLRWL